MNMQQLDRPFNKQLKPLGSFKPCSCTSVLGQGPDCLLASWKRELSDFAFVDLEQLDLAIQERTNIDEDVGVKSGIWIQAKFGLGERFIGQDTPNRRIPEPLATGCCGIKHHSVVRVYVSPVRNQDFFWLKIPKHFTEFLDHFAHWKGIQPRGGESQAVNLINPQSCRDLLNLLLSLLDFFWRPPRLFEDSDCMLDSCSTLLADTDY
jgi:hypothetical protein